MQTFEKTVSAAVQATDSGGFRGYAAKFLTIDRQGDMIIPGAFAKAIEAYLDDGGIALVDHVNKVGAVIGSVVNAVEDRFGLLVEARFSATKAAQEVRQMVMEKTLKKMSFRGNGRAARYSGNQILELWKTFGHVPTEDQKKKAAKGANVITSVDELVEISVVPIPANPGAEITYVKTFDIQQTPETHALYDMAELFRRATLVDRICRP